MKPLRIHCFQHVAFEGLGHIETWVRNNGHKLTTTRFFRQESLPAVSGFDWLIIMGGPMGVQDEDKYPWLLSEKAFIMSAIRADKTVIGICLGAQLVAEALGATVYPAVKKEIGWFPVSVTREAKSNRLFSDFPSSIPAFHWHGDTFDLPEGAIHLMQTGICRNQAFLFSGRVLGLQFHLEATPDTITDLAENCRYDIVPDEFVQTEKEILDRTDYCSRLNAYMEKILDALAGG